MSATGIPHQAKPPARSGSSPSGPAPGRVPSASRHVQPASSPDSRQPKFPDRAHDALRVRSHRVPAPPVTVHRRAQRGRASRGLSGIPDATLLKQKRTLGSNVPHPDGLRRPESPRLQGARSRRQTESEAPRSRAARVPLRPRRSGRHFDAPATGRKPGSWTRSREAHDFACLSRAAQDRLHTHARSCPGL